VADPGNEFYDAKVKVLSEMIKHHVNEKKNALKACCASACGGPGCGRVGDPDGAGEETAYRRFQGVRSSEADPASLVHAKAA